jgi:hypothetical protein
VKPNWACSICGQFSSRKYNMKRHIITLHNGYGAILSFTDYLVGRQMGYYLPSSVPTYARKHIDTCEVFQEELAREAARRYFKGKQG